MESTPNTSVLPITAATVLCTSCHDNEEGGRRRGIERERDRDRDTERDRQRDRERERERERERGSVDRVRGSVDRVRKNKMNFTHH